MPTNSNLSDEQIVKKLLSNEIKFYELEDIVGDYKRAARIRLAALRKKLGLDLKYIGDYSIEPINSKPNIENMFGAVQVPLGFAGPVRINGDSAKGDYILPLATTEGSLVASINRGCSAINKCGGADVKVFSNAQTRSLLFKTESLATLKKFVEWIETHMEEIKEVAESKSRYLKLEKVETYPVGTKVWLRLNAFTGDAMGMNMITIAGDVLGHFIEKKVAGVEFMSASGNLCVDKKPSAANLVLGRGKRVIAETNIEKSIFRKYFKTSPEDVAELNYLKNYMGSAAAGSYGFNAHFANIIAAFFIATGQDHAHIVEGSHGFTDIELKKDNIKISVTLPSMQIGTLGGGTRIETQKECLQILGVQGSGDPPGANALKLAEIIAVGVLAGEISLMGALSAHHLAKAHLRFNR